MSTLIFLGAALQPPVFKLCGSLTEVFLTRTEDLSKRNNPCHPCVLEFLPRDDAHNQKASDYSFLRLPQYCK